MYAIRSYYGRGSAYENLGQFDQAIKDYGEAIRLAPKVAQNYANRASSFGKLGRYPQAIRDYDEALRLGPRDDETLDAFAWLLVITSYSIHYTKLYDRPEG